MGRKRIHTVEYWREYDRKRALERYYSHAEERKQYNIEHHEEILEYGRNYRAKNRERAHQCSTETEVPREEIKFNH